MEQVILVRPDGSGRFLAQAIAFPECRAAGDTEENAVSQVKQTLAEHLGAAKLVRVDIPMSLTGNPWLDTFGRSATDPQFDDYQAELQRYRAEHEPE